MITKKELEKCKNILSDPSRQGFVLMAVTTEWIETIERMAGALKEMPQTYTRTTKKGGGFWVQSELTLAGSIMEEFERGKTNASNEV